MQNTPNASTTTDLSVYLQIKATPGNTHSAINELENLIAAHPNAAVRIAGISRNERHNLITVAVSIPANLVADKRADEAAAAFAFVNAAMLGLAKYLPSYAAAPASEAQDVARAYLAQRATTTAPHPARATAAHTVGKRITPRRPAAVHPGIRHNVTRGTATRNTPLAPTSA